MPPRGPDADRIPSSSGSSMAAAGIGFVSHCLGALPGKVLSDSLPSVTVTGRTSTTGKGDAVTKVDLHVRPLADIAAELRGFEARFGVASDRLLDAFRVDGKLRETDDFFAWSSLYAAWQAQRSLDTIVELPKLTDRRQRVRNLFLQRGVDRFDTENDVEACVTALEDERLRAAFEVALKQFLTSLDIVMPRPESLPFNRDAKFFGIVQVRARRRYREGDAFDASRYGEKVRALIDDHVLALGVDQKIPPVSIRSPDSATIARRHRRWSTRGRRADRGARHRQGGVGLLCAGPGRPGRRPATAGRGHLLDDDALPTGNGGPVAPAGGYPSRDGSTSDYWKPPFYPLEAAGFETWLVNAKDAKHLPGRPKTDLLTELRQARCCLAVQGRRAADAASEFRAPAADPGAARSDALPDRPGGRADGGAAAGGEVVGGRPDQVLGRGLGHLLRSPVGR